MCMWLSFKYMWYHNGVGWWNFLLSQFVFLKDNISNIFWVGWWVVTHGGDIWVGGGCWHFRRVMLLIQCTNTTLQHGLVRKSLGLININMINLICQSTFWKAIGGSTTITHVVIHTTYLCLRGTNTEKITRQLRIKNYTTVLSKVFKNGQWLKKKGRSKNGGLAESKL